jgi:hypothetical protein
VIHKRKRKAKPTRRKRTSKADRLATRKREAEELAHGLVASVDGEPPCENIRKHPDEVYGDTEIPNRGKALDQLKKVAQ